MTRRSEPCQVGDDNAPKGAENRVSASAGTQPHLRDCFTRSQKCDALHPRHLLLVPISDEIRHEGGWYSLGNATRCCGPCSSAVRPAHGADRGDRAQVLDQDPVDGESAFA